MKIKILMAFCLVCLLGLPIFAQDSRKSNSERIVYVNKNQVDPPLESVGEIEGLIIDASGDVVPFARIGLFTEEEHNLIAETIADKKGRFRFKKISEGEYRLVARVNYDYLCPLNMRIRKIALSKNEPQIKKRIVLHMIPSAIDTCSYGEVK